MEHPRVSLVTLGCARNEVDSEELAGTLTSGGWSLVEDPRAADVVLVNTCVFIESAKVESIDTILSLADMAGQQASGADAGGPDSAATGVPAPGKGPVVVAVGCMAERYGRQLAAELPEAGAVLGFDDYPQIAQRLREVMVGRPPAPREPADRRRLLPIAPVDRAASVVHAPGHLSGGHEAGPRWNDVRRRLGGGPVAALKIASGCDRRCTFCAIPSFRGSFISRPPADLVSEAQWLVSQGTREIVLVSENSTSYGKDLGSPGLLADLLSGLDGVPGLARLRVSYLQPAEVRPALVTRMISLPRVADYFDLSFQHASPTVLRAMRRFGGTDDFLRLIEDIREQSPQAGIRSNFIVGFPGESAEDLAELEDFLSAAQLDAIGIFGYSDEDGTQAATMPGKLAADEVRARVSGLSMLAEELMSQRAADRIGQAVSVLVESVAGAAALGRAQFQGPEDGETRVLLDPSRAHESIVGSILTGRVVASDGVDLHAVEVSDAHL